MSKHSLQTAFYSVLAIVFLLKTPAIQTLKCRTREHMGQQQDFYRLANHCMKSSLLTNATQQTNGTGSFDYRQHRAQQHQQRQPENSFDRDGFYGIDDRHRNNRYDTDGERLASVPNTCTCISQEGHIYRYGFDTYRRDKNEMRSTRYRRHKRGSGGLPVQKYVRKNTTNAASKKSPLEDIESCIVHCIFREMKMLNSENKADRQAMINTMTNRIRDAELKEFVQDSVEECFDIIDSDNHEESCDFSKKLILCLEEKAKRGCEDWEIRENSMQTSNFTFGKHFERQNIEENNEYYIHGTRSNDQNANSNKGGSGRWYSSSQRKQ